MLTLRSIFSRKQLWKPLIDNQSGGNSSAKLPETFTNVVQCSLIITHTIFFKYWILCRCDKMRCLHFLTILTIDTAELTHKGKIGGVFCELIQWRYNETQCYYSLISICSSYLRQHQSKLGAKPSHKPTKQWSLYMHFLEKQKCPWICLSQESKFFPSKFKFFLPVNQQGCSLDDFRYRWKICFHKVPFLQVYVL